MVEYSQSVGKLAWAIVGILMVLLMFESQYGTHNQSPNAASLKKPPRELMELSSKKFRVIKTYHDRSVYLLDQENIRHHIPDWATFVALGYDAKDLVTIPDQEMASYQEGNPLDHIEETHNRSPFRKCPCIRQSQYDTSLAPPKTDKVHRLCVVSSPLSSNILGNLIESQKSSASFQMQMISAKNASTDQGPSDDLFQEATSRSCDVVLALTNDTRSVTGKYLCPELCVAIPYTVIAVDWLQNPMHYMLTQPDVPITCSMTWRQVMADSASVHRVHSSRGLDNNRNQNHEPNQNKDQNNDNNDNHKEQERLRAHRLRRLSETSQQAKATNSVSASTSMKPTATADRHVNALTLLKAISRRRIEECREEEFWPKMDIVTASSSSSSSSSSAASAVDSASSAVPTATTAGFVSMPRRKVHGLIIWVGSRSRYDLLEAQGSILRDQQYFVDSSSGSNLHKKGGNSTGTSATGTAATASTSKGNDKSNNKKNKNIQDSIVVGWLASEDQYGCRLGSTLCDDDLIHGTSYYHAGMPQTRLNFAASGWACAQRRPLRALSHALLLYDADYILLGDDDTYVSWNMLQSNAFARYIRSGFFAGDEPVVLGQFTQGRKITRRGFFYGGSGYLMNKAALERLHGFQLPGPVSQGTAFVDFGAMTQLSLLYETGHLAAQYCSECIVVSSREHPEVKLTNWEVGQLNLVANSSARIVDLCVNLMSQEHTCYHSDHAMTRCLMHGINANALDIDCSGTTLNVPKNNNKEANMGDVDDAEEEEEGQDQNASNDLVLGMCMGTSFCNPKVQLTCHRWKPHPVDYATIAINLEANDNNNSNNNGAPADADSE